jgi:uncharacterized membrane protein YoaT (DUF817 family)
LREPAHIRAEPLIDAARHDRGRASVDSRLRPALAPSIPLDRNNRSRAGVVQRVEAVGRIERALHAGRVAGSAWSDRHGWWGRGLYELVVFGVKQGWAALFGGLMLAALFLTHRYYPHDAPVARYDVLVLTAVAIQLVMLATRMETLEEAKVILVYHAVGTVMEIFKTHVGSWEYPEESVLRIAGVPLFSGFMYAAVGSYIARVWRLFDFEFTRYPRRALTVALAAGIYANFFTHHAIVDVRWMLFLGTALLYRSTWVHFRVDVVHRRMPLLLGFLLVASFIWLAENIGTYAGAWVYPTQRDGWHLVSIAKLGSWYLLMIVSFVLVTLVSRPREHDATAARHVTPGRAAQLGVERGAARAPMSAQRLDRWDRRNELEATKERDRLRRPAHAAHSPRVASRRAMRLAASALSSQSTTSKSAIRSVGSQPCSAGKMSASASRNARCW